MYKFYTANETTELGKLLGNIDKLKSKIDARKTLKKERWVAIQEKLRVDWTYDSNAIQRLS